VGTLTIKAKNEIAMLNDQIEDIKIRNREIRNILNDILGKLESVRDLIPSDELEEFIKRFKRIKWIND
jgi:hypothetical protein